MTTYQYGIISDLHLYAWDAFSSLNDKGVNTRLQIILDEVFRAAQLTARTGATKLFIAGDVFHVRGKLAPSVLNPVVETFSEVSKLLDVHIIPGNHDLESKETMVLTNATQVLQEVGCTVHTNASYIELEDGNRVLMIPWRSSVAALKDEIKTLGGDGNTDLIIHAPVDGVIFGIPDHGLTHEWLAEQGFKRAFSGHYHNYRDFGNNVYSIGATTHQTWNDVGTKAGFLIVGDDRVKHAPSAAPKFVDFDFRWDKEQCKKRCEGNYIRVKGDTDQPLKVKALIKDKYGALGVVINSTPKPSAEVARGAVSVTSGQSLMQSVTEYIDKTFSDLEDKTLSSVKQECEDIMVEVESIAG